MTWRQTRITQTLVLTALCCGTYGCFLTGPSPLAKRVPADSTLTLPAVPATNARLAIPLAIPNEVLQGAIEHAVPHTFADSDELKILDLPGSKADVKVRYWWDVTRGSIRVASARDDVLSLSTRASGEVGLSGVADIDVGLSIAVEAEPRLLANWGLRPNYDVEVEITNPDVLPTRPIDLEGRIESKIDDKANSYQDEATAAVSDVIREIALPAWNALCTSVPIASEPGLWLQVTPGSARATHPRFSDTTAVLGLGVDAQLLVSTDSAHSGCDFPGRVRISSEMYSGTFESIIPVVFSYDELGSELSVAVADKTFGDDVIVQIKSLRVGPHNGKLLISTNVSARLSGFWGFFKKRAEGILHVLAEPRLDTARQVVSLTNVQMDTESQDVLSAALGELGERWLEDAFEDRMVLVVQPMLEKWRDQANAAIAELSSETLEVDAEIGQVRLTEIQVGRSYVRILGIVEGTATASLLSSR